MLVKNPKFEISAVSKKQYPKRNSQITSTDKVYLITNDNNITIPNMTGLSSKIAKGILEQLGVKTNLDGVGYVVSQSIQPTTPITDGMEITLVLNPKFAPSQ